MTDFNAILDENRRRNLRRDLLEQFDPVRGEGCSGDRVEVGPEPWTEGRELIPREMTLDKRYLSARTPGDWARLRCRHDFEYWAAKCCRIRDKNSRQIVPFILNRPQRRVVKLLEADRRAGRPMRMVILKARQWGGSTVVEMYMAWLQTVVATGCHAIVCGAEKTGTQVVVNLYSDMLAYYPEELWEGETPPRLRTHRGILQLEGRDTRVYTASSTNPNAIRGVDAALVHLTEAAYWKSTAGSDPWDTVRAIYCSVAMAPMTMVVMESTADGVGSFFHEEWLRAENGTSGKRGVFVPWHEIKAYSLPLATPDEARALWEAMDSYERDLWENEGLTLEQIHWYYRRRREMKDHSKMKSEFPSTPLEAFISTGSNVFNPERTAALRQGCREPLLIGDIVSASGEITGAGSLRSLRFEADTAGDLHIWQLPEKGASYVTAVDVGGLSDKADWSVVAVLRMGDIPEVVAQWRGHIDHDLLAWKGCMIATYYNKARLVFESNTLESHDNSGEAGYHQGALILHELYRHYRNLYRRRAPGGSRRDRIPGFHTNRRTKQMIISGLVAAVRDRRYIERSHEACDELDYYERRPNGSYGARQGRHDDLLMTRAIALHVCREESVDTAEQADLDDYLSRWGNR
ncbi:MAG: hypothetical protein K2L97_02685 [Muribaculaceae bacterium]|nr:hypothetical protein [Muribaculaceae bacterium]